MNDVISIYLHIENRLFMQYLAELIVKKKMEKKEIPPEEKKNEIARELKQMKREITEESNLRAKQGMLLKSKIVMPLFPDFNRGTYTKQHVKIFIKRDVAEKYKRAKAKLPAESGRDRILERMKALVNLTAREYLLKKYLLP